MDLLVDERIKAALAPFLEEIVTLRNQVMVMSSQIQVLREQQLINHSLIKDHQKNEHPEKKTLTGKRTGVEVQKQHERATVVRKDKNNNGRVKTQMNESVTFNPKKDVKKPVVSSGKAQKNHKENTTKEQKVEKQAKINQEAIQVKKQEISVIEPSQASLLQQQIDEKQKQAIERELFKEEDTKKNNDSQNLVETEVLKDQMLLENEVFISNEEVKITSQQIVKQSELCEETNSELNNVEEMKPSSEEKPKSSEEENSFQNMSSIEKADPSEKESEVSKIEQLILNAPKKVQPKKEIIVKERTPCSKLQKQKLKTEKQTPIKPDTLRKGTEGRQKNMNKSMIIPKEKVDKSRAMNKSFREGDKQKVLAKTNEKATKRPKEALPTSEVKNESKVEQSVSLNEEAEEFSNLHPQTKMEQKNDAIELSSAQLNMQILDEVKSMSTMVMQRASILFEQIPQNLATINKNQLQNLSQTIKYIQGLKLKQLLCFLKQIKNTEMTASGLVRLQLMERLVQILRETNIKQMQGEEMLLEESETVELSNVADSCSKLKDLKSSMEPDFLQHFFENLNETKNATMLKSKTNEITGTNKEEIKA